MRALALPGSDREGRTGEGCTVAKEIGIVAEAGLSEFGRRHVKSISDECRSGVTPDQ